MKIRVSGRSIVLLFLALSLSVATNAQQPGSIRGVVTNEINGDPVEGVAVTITQLRRNVETNENGVYEFTDVPPGRYTIITHIEGFSDQARNIALTGGVTGSVDFSLSLAALREEVVVSTTGAEQSVYDSFQSVEGVGTNRIREQASTSIGEVLEREAGVGKRSFGPGASRPTIRGFESDRVLVLQDGIRNGSLGFQSGDHGEPVDTLNLERLEVIKGPATLLYGSNAIGGVVNAVTGDENDSHPGLRGNFSMLGSTNNRQGGVSGGVEYGFGKILFNGAGSFLREGDFRTPLGTIPNSASRASGGNFGVGYFSNKYFLRGTFNVDRRRYGVPYAPLFEEGAFLSGNCEVEPELGDGPCVFDIFAIREQFLNSLPDVPDEAIDLRMQRNNYRFLGGFRGVRGPIAQGDFSLDFTDYQHEEIESVDGEDEIATQFFNDVFSYRAFFQQANYHNLSGRFGFEGFRRSYLTEGAESLIDGRVRQNSFAIFGLQELDFDRVAIQIGGRLEDNRYRPVNPVYPERSFTGLSAAAGIRLRLWQGASFVTNLSTSFRAPALEEIYNLGPHVGTVTFEVGDLNLTRERSNGIEVSLRQNYNRLRLNGSFYYYDIKDFVYLAPQDSNGDGFIDVEDGLPVADYLQNDSRFKGFDLTADYDFTDYLGAFVNADIVVQG